MTAPLRTVQHFVRTLVAAAALTLVGCASSHSGGTIDDGATGAALDGPADADALRDRADRMWSAVESREWATVFDYEDPRANPDATVEDFVAWAEQDYPFRVEDYTVGRVLTQDDVGWVEMNVTSALGKFADAPARTVDRWDTWQKVQGKWVPVPGRYRSNYPITPAERDLEAEKVVRERCEDFWRARAAENWERLLELCEPADRAGLEPMAVADAQSTLTYVDHDILWVEAVGDRARTRVIYTHKLNDPNLTKAPPMRVPLTETWVKVDGTWYLDMIDNSRVGTAQGGTQETTP